MTLPTIALLLLLSSGASALQGSKRLADALGDVSVTSDNHCVIKWDNKMLDIRLEDNFEKKGRVIEGSFFIDWTPKDGKSFYHSIGLGNLHSVSPVVDLRFEGNGAFAVTTKRSGEETIEYEEMGKAEEAYDFFSGLTPFVKLRKEVNAELRNWIPHQRNSADDNMAKCRKVFVILATNPPRGYDTGLEWVASFYERALPLPSLVNVKRVVKSWEAAPLTDEAVLKSHRALSGSSAPDHDIERMADVDASGEGRLIMVDRKRRIRVYQGTKVAWEQLLPAIPTAVQPFYPSSDAAVPSIAVASGADLFVYRFLKPHLKFTLPAIEATAEELAIWQSGPQDLRFAALKSRRSDRYEAEESGLALPELDEDAAESVQWDANRKIADQFLMCVVADHGLALAVPEREIVPVFASPRLPDDLDVALDFYLGRLQELRESGKNISVRAQDILATVENPRLMEGLLNEVLQVDASDDAALLQTWQTITCLDALKKNQNSKTAVSMLVAACESGTVFVLNSGLTGIATKVDLPEGSVPALMAVSGLYDLEYRIVIATRGGAILSIKNGQVMNVKISLDAMPVGLVKLGKMIYVGCMNFRLHCYHVKGKKMHTLLMPAPILAMEEFSWETTGTMKVLVVALRNGEIRIYNGKHLVNTITLRGGHMVAGVCLGTYGREEATMAVSTKAGAVILKILQRDVKLNTKEGSTAGPPPEQDIPLNVPKKTRLYIEQTEREREQPVEIHRAFQRDLCKLRLRTVREYVKILSANRRGQITTVKSSGSDNKIDVKASVQGIGPLFRLSVSITARGGGRPLADMILVTFPNTQLYSVDTPQMRLPTLVPGIEYSFYIPLQFIGEPASGITDSVRLLIVDAAEHGSKPRAIYVVHMPVSDVDIE
ncbi:Bardet-Biedl syndrome 1 protein [Perkinsus olseni]|uniref:Bardet-Biedl syndrome 1 protein n=1 Tax=Perkinsus olseni TaxID=32597 RepID=A0A7J6ML21_PEROL|nr:Bardet-Biedl syndrome 1 protein [Perkinsus olseni]